MGGFLRGAVHELVTPAPGSMVLTLAWRAAIQAAGPRGWMVYVDLAGDFYPPAAAQLGAPLHRVLVLRPQVATQCLWAVEQVLRCRTVKAAILPDVRINTYVSRRLQLAAESSGCLGLLLRTLPLRSIETSQRLTQAASADLEPTFAATRLRIDPLPALPGERRARVTVLKMREGAPGATIVLEFDHAARSLSAHAAAVARPREERARTLAV